MTKIIVTLIFCLLAIIVNKSNCGVVIMGNGFSNTNGLNIYEKNGVFHCGSLECSPGSRCIITQKNNPNNTAELVTRQKCFDGDDNLIKQSEYIEDVNPNHIINQRIESGGSGSFIYNPELQHQIEQTVSHSLQNVQDTLHNIFSRPLVPDLQFGSNFPFGPNNSPFGPGFPFNNNNDYAPNNNNGDFVPLPPKQDDPRYFVPPSKDNRRDFVPPPRYNDDDFLLKPRLGDGITNEQTNPVNKKQNNREDYDSDEQEERNAIPKI